MFREELSTVRIAVCVSIAAGVRHMSPGPVLLHPAGFSDCHLYRIRFDDTHDKHGPVSSPSAVQVTALGQPQMLEALSAALSAGQPPGELPDRQLALMDATVARLSTLATAASKVHSSPLLRMLGLSKTGAFGGLPELMRSPAARSDAGSQPASLHS
jgi:hypothetical protein